MPVEARFYHRLDGGRIACDLCPHACRLDPGQKGICRVRANEDGKLVTYSFGQVTAVALDPIEKKPLYHFHPGKAILSIGTWGCNLACPWCQNYHIAAEKPRSRYLSPEEAAALALEARSDGSVGVAYTYNEPTIFLEYVLACADLVKGAGQANVLVTNGYISRDPLREALSVVDAMNIDLKGFSPDFYRRFCRGSLPEVWETIEAAAASCHVEVTTLVIEGLNDDPADIAEAARRMHKINPNIPWHLSAFHPAHRMTDRRVTSRRTLDLLRDVVKEHMNYVYLGNVPGVDNNTYCPRCGSLLIERPHYQGQAVGLSEGRCRACGMDTEIIN